MDTVQIQCGHCRRVMAIQREHLGSQVHCPHCQAIVQAPAGVESDKAGADRAPVEHLHEPESIFNAAPPSDDIFGHGLVGQQVTIPEEVRPGGHSPQNHQAFGAEESRAGQPPDAAALVTSTTTHRTAKRGSLAMLLLIFLIPYSVLATGGIAYLAYRLVNQNPVDPLERLPDPNPKDGGPRLQIAHDAPLPSRLKTRLGQALRIGAIEVTPLKVKLAQGELILYLRVKNISPDLLFNPVSQDFMKFGKAAAGNRPYTYLDAGPTKIFGGIPEWLKEADGDEEPIRDGRMGPGQEEIIRIATPPKSQSDIERVGHTTGPLIWRVQVRRGLVSVHGAQVSATAVIGVEFNAKEIQREG